MPSPHSILIHKYATEVSVNSISYRFKTGSSLSVSFYQHSLHIQVFHSYITNTIWSWQFSVSLNKKNSLSLYRSSQINNVLNCTDMKWNGVLRHTCEFCRYETNTLHNCEITVILSLHYHELCKSRFNTYFYTPWVLVISPPFCIQLFWSPSMSYVTA
jgi:hypothetical protein